MKKRWEGTFTRLSDAPLHEGLEEIRQELVKRGEVPPEENQPQFKTSGAAFSAIEQIAKHMQWPIDVGAKSTLAVSVEDQVIRVTVDAESQQYQQLQDLERVVKKSVENWGGRFNDLSSAMARS